MGGADEKLMALIDYRHRVDVGGQPRCRRAHGSKRCVDGPDFDGGDGSVNAVRDTHPVQLDVGMRLVERVRHNDGRGSGGHSPQNVTSRGPRVITARYPALTGCMGSLLYSGVEGYFGSGRAARVGLLLRTVPSPGLVAGRRMCSASGSVGTLVTEPLPLVALAAGRGSERGQGR